MNTVTVWRKDDWFGWICFIEQNTPSQYRWNLFTMIVSTASSSTTPTSKFFFCTHFANLSMMMLQRGEKNLPCNQNIINLLNYFLSLSQMTNFLLFQTERVGRWQFQTWQKRQLFKRVENTVEKGEIARLRAISPFPTVFLKDLYCRHVKTMGLFGKGLISSLIPKLSTCIPKNSLDCEILQ